MMLRDDDVAQIWVLEESNRGLLWIRSGQMKPSPFNSLCARLLLTTLRRADDRQQTLRHASDEPNGLRIDCLSEEPPLLLERLFQEITAKQFDESARALKEHESQDDWLGCLLSNKATWSETHEQIPSASVENLGGYQQELRKQLYVVAVVKSVELGQQLSMLVDQTRIDSELPPEHVWHIPLPCPSNFVYKVRDPTVNTNIVTTWFVCGSLDRLSQCALWMYLIEEHVSNVNVSVSVGVKGEQCGMIFTISDTEKTPEALDTMIESALKSTAEILKGSIETSLPMARTKAKELVSRDQKTGVHSIAQAIENFDENPYSHPSMEDLNIGTESLRQFFYENLHPDSETRGRFSVHVSYTSVADAVKAAEEVRNAQEFREGCAGLSKDLACYCPDNDDTDDGAYWRENAEDSSQSFLDP